MQNEITPACLQIHLSADFFHRAYLKYLKKKSWEAEKPSLKASVCKEANPGVPFSSYSIDYLYPQGPEMRKTVDFALIWQS